MSAEQNKSGAFGSAPVPARGAASFTPKSADRKLAPTTRIQTPARPRPVPIGPFVSVTSTSIDATCSSACPLKDAGCYVQTGFTKFAALRLDNAARGHTPEEVVAEEGRLIDRAFKGGRIPQDGARGGRDLRIHVGGDVGSNAGAELLGEACDRWVERGGARPWTYTHLYREILRGSWGRNISVLASVHHAEDIEVARSRGYAAAIVLDAFPSDKAFTLPDTSARIIPCPAETRGTTCVKCRLCLDDQALLERNAAIAFEKHGPGTKTGGHGLVQLRRKPESATALRSEAGHA